MCPSKFDTTSNWDLETVTLDQVVLLVKEDKDVMFMKMTHKNKIY